MNTQTQNTSFDKGAAEKAQMYQQSVLEYEKLDEQVDALLTAKGGHTENMSEREFSQLRALAEQRDIAYNQMKTLEQDLLDEA